MLKKTLVAGGAVALLTTMAAGVPLASYVRCGINSVRESASDAMPIEWELKRARQMIVDLKPEITKNARRIAREKIEVARLEKKVAETESRLAKAQSDIERLTDDLQSGSKEYTYAGYTYTSAQVKEDLKGRFDRFKTRRATADTLAQMLNARKASLVAAEQRMEEMLGKKSQLEVEVENMQARLGALRVAQTASELNLDDSHLSRTRGLLDEIEMRLNEEEETLVVNDEYFGEINLDAPSDENLLDEITAYLETGDSSTKAYVAITLE
ncbi:MAG: hypothetical protein AAFX06_27925 [Planctomycetota bacterium]